MTEDVDPIEPREVGKFFVPSLFLSRFSLTLPTTLLSLLLIEIGLTFGLQVGIIGQISATNSLVSLIASIIMGALSVRFSHKRLLITGLLIRVLSTVACALSASFYTMLFFFSFNGIGTALITPMTMSLPAEHLQGENRASAIGWIMTCMPLSSIVGSLGINYIAGVGGWRLPFLMFILPINVLSLILVMKGIPSSKSTKTNSGTSDVFKGYTAVLSSRSALASLVGVVFSAASIGGFVVYLASFFRQTFFVSTDFASLMFIGTALFQVLGTRIAGYLLRRITHRFLWTLGMILAGVGVILALNLPSLWVSLLLAFVVFVQFGLVYTAANTLMVDLVPSFRGTIMSLLTAAEGLAITLGASVGGLILLNLSYGALGLILGLFGFVAALIVYLWAK